MNTYTLQNSNIGEIVTVQADTLVEAKFKAAKLFRGYILMLKVARTMCSFGGQSRLIH